MTITVTDWQQWARDVAQDFDDVAMIVRFEPPGTPPGEHHLCLVMNDGPQRPWFAAGKAIDGMAWAAVPGRDACERLRDDPRLCQPRLHVYLNFCDARALMFAADGGGQRIAGAELIDAPYRVLHPAPADRPALDEFRYHWGEECRERTDPS